MVAPTITAGHPEPVIVDRITRGGRRLWYHLEVIQQPERARACGAGPKSSADRRPVDPPPVVELRIFEGPSMEHAKDITFTYNANFFLFATLEHARVLAHGRLQPPSAATPPVLTGMPVSGMAYLDRPKEAGYFLFPDLSVRHEGRYRLTFNLFEQTKEFADLDKETHDGAAHTPESFDWRMEVKSNDFMVFSAKKFPGLTESTALSRTVAEQGCRVRIRRDVRMRRREGKSSTTAVAGSGDVRAEEEYARRHRTQTPEVVTDYRARSMSTESVNRTPYVPDANHAQRRPSMSDHYHSAAPSPQSGPSLPPAFGASSGGPHMSNSAHLRFGGNAPSSFAQPASVPPSPTTYSAPAHSYAQPSQPQPQQQPQQPPQHTQHHSTSSFSAPSPAPSHANTTSPPPNPSHSYYQDRPASQHYTTAPPPPPAAAPAPSPKHESFDYHRRVSNSYTPAPLAIEPANDRRDSRMISPAESKTLTLPSLSEMISFQDEKRQAPPPPPSNNNTTSPNSDRVPSLSQLLLPQPVLSHPSAPTSQSSSGPAPQKKRSYGQYNNMDPVAEAYATNTAVKNHARQTEAPRERDFEQLWWKRADGSVWTAHGEVSR